MADEKKLSPMARLVVAGAQNLFPGDRWQSPFARISHVSAALLQKIAAGDVAVTDKTANKIANALIDEADARRKGADKVDVIAEKILAKLEAK